MASLERMVRGDVIPINCATSLIYLNKIDHLGLVWNSLKGFLTIHGSIGADFILYL